MKGTGEKGRANTGYGRGRTIRQLGPFQPAPGETETFHLARGASRKLSISPRGAKFDFSISPLLDFQGISAQLGFFLFLSVAMHCGEEVCFASLGFVRHAMLCYAILGWLRFAIRSASDCIAMVCYVPASHSSSLLSRSLHRDHLPYDRLDPLTESFIPPGEVRPRPRLDPPARRRFLDTSKHLLDTS